VILFSACTIFVKTLCKFICRQALALIADHQLQQLSVYCVFLKRWNRAFAESKNTNVSFRAGNLMRFVILVRIRVFVCASLRLICQGSDRR
jgi:hypothetical protein